jgi:hypothetical protein
MTDFSAANFLRQIAGAVDPERTTVHVLSP